MTILPSTKQVLIIMVLMIVYSPSSIGNPLAKRDSHLKFCNPNDYALRFAMIIEDSVSPYVTGFMVVPADSCRHWPMRTDDASFIFTISYNMEMVDPRYVVFKPKDKAASYKMTYVEACLPRYGQHFSRKIKEGEYKGRNVVQCPDGHRVAPVSFGLRDAAIGNQITTIYLPKDGSGGTDMYDPKPQPTAGQAAATKAAEIDRRELYLSYKQRSNQEFLQENKMNPNLVELSSGVQYDVIAEGDGAEVTPNSEVTTRYVVYTLESDVIEDLYKKNVAEYKMVRDLLPGLKEVLPKMRVGDKWRIFIPPEMAYGAEGLEGKIEPHELLIYELEVKHSHIPRF
ncbi:MAG: FKBP-type peptidyl-prolyl cis-trans isomerase [Candidatus Thiodiazotropha taylori]